jgi:uncharacterized membrane protein
MWLFRLMDGWAKYLIPEKYAEYLPYGVPGLGICLLFLSLVLVGMFTTNYVGRWAVKTGQKILARVPVISGIYSAIKKVFETLMGDGGSQSFRQAVLIEYPRKGLWTIAFVTAPVYKGMKKYLPNDMITVYVPTTPNPTSGFMIYVAKKDIKELDIPVEEALKMVLSMGIVNPTKKP